MISWFRSTRAAVRDLKAALADRDFWKGKAESYEAEFKALRQKYDDRSDFFVEREFKIIDRFFTAERKTYAITDEIRSQRPEATQQDVNEAALEEHLKAKKEWLIQCAIDAGFPNPVEIGTRDFEKNISRFILDFQQDFATRP
jgi:hypothetical protein